MVTTRDRVDTPTHTTTDFPVVYAGCRTGRAGGVVYVIHGHDEPYRLPVRKDIFKVAGNTSRHNWGERNVEFPAKHAFQRLAFDILYHTTSDDVITLELYPDFTNTVIEGLSRNMFRLSQSGVQEWIRGYQGYLRSYR